MTNLSDDTDMWSDIRCPLCKEVEVDEMQHCKDCNAYFCYECIFDRCDICNDNRKSPNPCPYCNYNIKLECGCLICKDCYKFNSYNPKSYHTDHFFECKNCSLVWCSTCRCNMFPHDVFNSTCINKKCKKCYSVESMRFKCDKCKNKLCIKNCNVDISDMSVMYNILRFY